MTKVVKTGVKKAIIFYFDEDTQLPRMVMFGVIDELMPFYFEMMEVGFKRLQGIIKEAGGRKDMTLDEMLEIVQGSRPPWMRDNSAKVARKARLSLTYEMKKV